MTREEAIIVLRSYRIPQNEEAIDMAIKALETTEHSVDMTYYYICPNCGKMYIKEQE